MASCPRGLCAAPPLPQPPLLHCSHLCCSFHIADVSLLLDAVQSGELPDFSLETGGFALDGFALEGSGGGGGRRGDTSDEGSESE